MRGFRIIYLGGNTDIINSDNGNEAGVINFEEFDELVGLNMVTLKEGDTRPRRVGFTLMRNA